MRRAPTLAWVVRVERRGPGGGEVVEGHPFGLEAVEREGQHGLWSEHGLVEAADPAVGGGVPAEAAGLKAAVRIGALDDAENGVVRAVLVDDLLDGDDAPRAVLAGTEAVGERAVPLAAGLSPDVEGPAAPRGDDELVPGAGEASELLRDVLPSDRLLPALVGRVVRPARAEVLAGLAAEPRERVRAVRTEVAPRVLAESRVDLEDELGDDLVATRDLLVLAVARPRIRARALDREDYRPQVEEDVTGQRRRVHVDGDDAVLERVDVVHRDVHREPRVDLRDSDVD
mmetsp:Transcript_1506/g.4532  ORF Transcript_1506/g.4532 Transcript_1506/m.4532 type:complete len:286 (-) Transcript_1506:75-932(-)